MKVEQMMTRDVRVCSVDDRLNHAAQLMWDCDLGCVPVIEADGRLAGVITDRDVCMAAYTQGRRLDEIRVGEVMSRHLHTIAPQDTLETAATVMKRNQLRRLPVMRKNELVGILSMADLSRSAEAEPNQRVREQYLHQVEAALAAITRPRPVAHA